MSLNIGILLVEDFQLTDAAGPMDLFFMCARNFTGWARSGIEQPPTGIDNLTLHWIGPTLDPFSSYTGVKLLPTCTYDTVPKLDILFIPGPMPDYVPSAEATAYIRRAVEETPIVMAVCTGPLVLAQLGILDGQRACINADFIDHVKKTYPKVLWREDVRWNVEGKFWTSGGIVGSGMSMVAAFLKSGRFGDMDAMVAAAAEGLDLKPNGQQL
jgi:transcriptional regulator GlxA family with amidase domain